MVVVLETDFFTVDVVSGTPVANATVGTISGAVHGAKAIKIRQKGDIITYQIIVVHDDGTPINLEYSFVSQTLAENTTPDLDNTGLTVAGAIQDVTITHTLTNVGTNTFDIFVTHLDA